MQLPLQESNRPHVTSAKSTSPFQTSSVFLSIKDLAPSTANAASGPYFHIWQCLLPNGPTARLYRLAPERSGH